MTERITSRENGQIKQYGKLRTSAKARRESALFVMEGHRLCMDALESGVKLEALFYTAGYFLQHGDVLYRLAEKCENTYEITDSVAARLADTKSPQGIFCVGHTLDKSNHLVTIKKNNSYLALEEIADPNNLGTILRTAEAFSVDGVILSRSCCDLYAPKVLRGSMGAFFRLKTQVVEDLAAFLEQEREKGIFSFAAVPNRDAQSILTADFSEGGIMLIGNEANGLHAETAEAATYKVTIPMRGGAESLNAAVAASILIWQMEAGRRNSISE